MQIKNISQSIVLGINPNEVLALPDAIANSYLTKFPVQLKIYEPEPIVEIKIEEEYIKPVKLKKKELKSSLSVLITRKLKKKPSRKSKKIQTTHTN